MPAQPVSRRLAWAWVASFAVVALSPAAAHAQDHRLATLGAPAEVSTHGGITAYSQRLPDGRFRLMVDPATEGAPQPVPVASRGAPFDVDLGPGPGGGVVAAYSRCRTEPQSRPSSRPAPAHATGRGCDLYLYDFAAARERRLDGASTGKASEFLPSVWRDEVAFARVFESRSGRRGRLPYLYVRRLDDTQPSRRQPGGARGISGLPGPGSLDLYGRRLSFSWTWERSPGGQSELRLDTVGASHRVVAKSGWKDSLARYLTPHASEGRILFGYQRAIERDGADQSLGSRVLRHRISTRELWVSGEIAPFVAAVARDRSSGVTAVMRSEGWSRMGECRPVCELRRVGDLDFERRRGPAPDRTYTYAIRTRGDVQADTGTFASVASSTLSDSRGWSLGGALRFRRVAAGAGQDFNLILAGPSAVERAAPLCSSDYSCRVGDDVLINDRRWRTATQSWTQGLGAYRRYAINHEVGHWLGLGEAECPQPDEPAPVMHQQSISLDGCEANQWPLPAERERVAKRQGTTVR